MRKSTKFFLLRASIIVTFAVLASRIWYIQVVMGSYYRQQADTSKIRLEPVAALRGIIYDRKGKQLVFNAPAWNVTVVPHGVPRSQSGAIYLKLSQLLSNNPSPEAIRRKVLAGAWQPYAPVHIKDNISSDVAMIIKQLHTQLPGVRAEPTSVRQYVNDSEFSLAHILGYTSAILPDRYISARRTYPVEHVGRNDQQGSDGVESSLDPYLHGVNGTERVEVDSGERPIRILRHAQTVPGDSVYLTIDWNLQQHVANDLQAALTKLGVRKGVAVVEEVNTGRVLAAVSLPSFNNNWFSGGISTRRYASLLNNPDQPLNNLAIAGQYAPGSTYKIVTAAAALETGVADVTRTIDDTGLIKLCSVYDPHSCQYYYGWNANGLGTLNVVGALAKSSDIYFYTVSGGNPNVDPNMPYIGADRLARYARLLGLGSPTGIELPNEAPGLVPSRTWFDALKNPLLRHPGEQWHIGNTYNMAIGQGQDQATPLQMANLTATIANGGTLYQPHIVDRIVGQLVPRRGILRRSQSVRPFVPTPLRRNFISPGNLALIQIGMHHSVDWPGFEGTSFAVRDPRIDAAGKTGTAEATGGPHAWWVGYAPFNNPRIAVAVVVPNADTEGAYGAAPIAHKIFEDYFHLKPDKPDWLVDVQHYLVGSTRAG